MKPTGIPNAQQWLSSIVTLVLGIVFAFTMTDRVGTLLAGIILGISVMAIITYTFSLSEALRKERH